MNNLRNTFGPYDDNGPYPYPYYPQNEQGQPPPPPLAPRRRASFLDEHIDKLQAEVAEARARLVNNSAAELETIVN